MKIAVLSLTRDRLEYTKHCFGLLWEYDGDNIDHYVLDQGSQDDSLEWLSEQFDDGAIHTLVDARENMGIALGLNLLTEAALENADYDVIVHFDNDCELTEPNTILDTAVLAYEGGALLSPRILGLSNPPAVIREAQINGDTILEVPQIGGICLTAPAWVFDEFQYPEDLPKWGKDDATICKWFRDQGGTVGYVKRLEAWHYLTTTGQWLDESQAAYYARKAHEHAPGI